uniref:Uncharacterized protein n=1 Tax=Steinernema glaseri TaxID=37863 RepID=A0A1I7ZTW7_9BILA
MGEEGWRSSADWPRAVSNLGECGGVKHLAPAQTSPVLDHFASCARLPPVDPPSPGPGRTWEEGEIGRFLIFFCFDFVELIVKSFFEGLTLIGQDSMPIQRREPRAVFGNPPKSIRSLPANWFLANCFVKVASIDRVFRFITRSAIPGRSPPLARPLPPCSRCAPSSCSFSSCWDSWPSATPCAPRWPPIATTRAVDSTADTATPPASACSGRASISSDTTPCEPGPTTKEDTSKRGFVLQLKSSFV